MMAATGNVRWSPLERVVLVGAYPPPVGGNSVHVQRLQNALIRRGIRCDVIDLYNAGRVREECSGTVYRYGGNPALALSKLPVRLRSLRPSVVHFHVSAFGKFNLVAPLLLSASPAESKTVLTIHSGSFVARYRKQNVMSRWLTRRVIRGMDRIIAVSSEQADLLRELSWGKAEVNVIPAFLPATIGYPGELVASKIRSLKRGYSRLICTSGYGVSLYGFEQIIKAVSSPRLANQFALVVCTYNTHDPAYMDYLARESGGSGSIIMLRDLGPEEFSYVLNESDIYVRSTDRDGDAVAIREAHAFGLAVIASDATARPEFCHVYPLGDVSALTETIEKVAQRSDSASCRTDQDDCIDGILAVYCS